MDRLHMLAKPRGGTKKTIHVSAPITVSYSLYKLFSLVCTQL